MSNLFSAVLGISFAAGLNSYATILALGVLGRLGVLDLPAGLKMLASTPVIAVAALLYMVEFFADKVPLIDTVWDSIHTFVRPAAGALLSYSVVGNVDPQWQVIAALAGGGLALTSHTAKATTRAAVNLSPEPFSNWILSFSEDAISFALVWLIGSHPYLVIGIVVGLVTLAGYIIWRFSNFARRVFRRAT